MVDTWRSPKALYSAVRRSSIGTPSSVGLVAVDVQRGLQAALLRVAGDVAEHRVGAHALHAAASAQSLQLAGLHALQDVLVVRLALAAAELQVLDRLHVDG